MRGTARRVARLVHRGPMITVTCNRRAAFQMEAPDDAEHAVMYKMAAATSNIKQALGYSRQQHAPCTMLCAAKVSYTSEGVLQLDLGAPKTDCIYTQTRGLPCAPLSNSALTRSTPLLALAHRSPSTVPPSLPSFHPSTRIHPLSLLPLASSYLAFVFAPSTAIRTF